MSKQAYSRLTTAMPAMLAIVAALSYAAVFYPGAMGFDGAYQWWQARGGETSNIHGVAMTWLFRISDATTSGPGGLFVLQLALFWTGLALIATSIRSHCGWQATFAVFAAAAAPVCFVLFSSVASDAMLMACLTCALGIMLHVRSGQNRLWLLPALLLLCLALLLRKNALLAIIPLLTYLFFVATRTSNSGVRARCAALTVALLAIMQLGSWSIDRTVDRRVTVFATTGLWDLAAISLAVGQILLPAETHGPGLTLDDLGQAFVPYTAASIFDQTHAGMRQPSLAPTIRSTTRYCGHGSRRYSTIRAPILRIAGV